MVKALPLSEDVRFGVRDRGLGVEGASVAVGVGGPAAVSERFSKT